MLVLARKMLEKIYIGDDIVVVVTDIDRGKIKLGIYAPSGVTILREELIDEDTKRQIEYRATNGRGL